MAVYNDIVNNFDGETSDFKAFLKALRDAIPEEDHPKKDFYTAKEILSLFEPDYNCSEVEDYGSVKCRCGHNIKYAYSALYRQNPGIVVQPIGSKCINKFTVLFDGANLKQILDTFSGQRIYAESPWDRLSTEEFSAMNGFDKPTMDYLKGVLDVGQWSFLSHMVRKRKKIYLTLKQLNLFYSIICKIKDIYAHSISASQPIHI